MARRNNDDEGKAVKKIDRGAQKAEEQEEGKEEDAQKERSQETETSRSQRQLGNSAIAGMLANAGKTGTGGGAGVDVEMARRKADQEKEGQDFGGEDDGGDPNAPIEVDLSESWNPGATQPSDRPEFLEPMPDDELPPEDAEWLEGLERVGDPPDAPATSASDALVQPSPEILARSIAGWCRGAARISGAGLHRRAWAHLLTHPGSTLQDPWGRVLVLRARTAALSVAAVLSSPLIPGGADARTCAFVDFVLELEARDNLVRAARLSLAENERPQAQKITLQLLDGASGQVRPRALSGPARGVLDRTLRALLVLDDPMGLVPRFPEEEEEEEEDDPLGIQALIVAHTGGEKDPHEALFKSAIQAAERVAAAIQATRLRFAGTTVAIADVACLWSAGAPADSLVAVMAELDAGTDATMQLLREIARAAQKRQVGAAGLRQGLTRAARDLQRVREETIAKLDAIVGGILPGDPQFSEIEAEPDDPLTHACGDGRPEHALPWLASLPDSLDRDAAIAFVRLSARTDVTSEIDRLLALRERATAERSDMLAFAAGVAAGAACLHVGRHEEAAAIGADHVRFGLSRSNGILVAEGAILGTEALYAAGDVEGADALRRRVGAAVWQMGARGALTLLARWTPPADEPEESPFFASEPDLPESISLEEEDAP